MRKRCLIILFFINLILFSSCKFKHIESQSKEKSNLSLVNTTQDTIIVKGKITKIAYGYCGTICNGGSIEVKLDQAENKYHKNYIYVITACMNNAIKTNTDIDVIATKLTSNDKECYYIHFSRIDTLKHEYYKLNESETAKIKPISTHRDSSLHSE